MLVLVVTWFSCDSDSSDWFGNNLWYLGRCKKCCPGVWTLVWIEQTNLFFSLVSIFVLLRFLTFRNLTSVLNGWLDAPRRGLLGFFFLFSTWDFVFGFDDIPHSFSPAGPRGRCADAQDALARFHGLVPPGLYLSQTHTNTHTPTYTYTQVLQIPQWTSFFNIYCLQFDKKLYNLKNIFLIL